MLKRQKLLWVDDDIYFVHRFQGALEDEGFDVLCERDATSGLNAFEAYRSEIVAIVLDMAMDPGQQFSNLESLGGHYAGLSLARRIHLLYHNLQIVGLCHVPNDDAKQWFADKRFYLLLKSKITTNMLTNIIKRSLSSTHVNKFSSFIVHGHDTNIVLELKNYIQNTLKLGEPIILKEKPSQSMTIIEKFEKYANDILLVFVLLTPDDRGLSSDTFRARQNVIFELGYFYSHLRRGGGRVILLHKGNLELPSDISGVAYIDISSGIHAAGEEIRRELSDWI